MLSEPTSGQRQFFSGKEVGYIRRHFRSLRRSLGKKKAQRAIERIGQKETRWMKDYNRKLAKEDNHFLVAGEFNDESALSSFQKIVLPDDEAYAANCLRINDRIIMPKGFPKTYRQIRALGYPIIEVETSEFRKNEGSLTCLSLRF
ncbi:hypothetical protein [Natribacillus halophilus]|nr:hypothetical protein [Natribacillus halophilus]